MMINRWGASAGADRYVTLRGGVQGDDVVMQYILVSLPAQCSRCDVFDRRTGLMITTDHRLMLDVEVRP